MENYTDLQLIDMYFEGDLKAFDGIINHHSRIIYRFVFNLIGNIEETHDITQETFIKVWKNLKKFDKTKNFKTWLFTIARRTAIDYLRKRKNISFSSLDNDEMDTTFEQTIRDEEILADEIFEKNENVEIIKKALAEIPLEQKAIVLLHNGEEMTFEEIAEIVGKPMNTIKSQYRRTLFALKKSIISQNAPK